MFDWMEILRIGLKIIFWGILPAVILYYRYRRKFTTGFTTGSILTCLIFGLFSVATVVENPVEKFMTVVNTGDYKESKRTYKILVQQGPEFLKRVKVNDIVDLKLFEKLKKDIIGEYHEIANRYNRTITISRVENCDEAKKEAKKMNKLHHALLLLDYAGYIGGDFSDLRKSIREKISAGEKITADNKKLCE